MEVKAIRTLEELPPLGQVDCNLTPEEIAAELQPFAAKRRWRGKAPRRGLPAPPEPEWERPERKRRRGPRLRVSKRARAALLGLL